MQISVTFRNIKPSEGIKNYAEKKIGRLKRFLNTENLEANLVLSIEKFRHIAELNVWADGEQLYGREEAEDTYAAIDTVVDKIERQIEKRKIKYRKSEIRVSKPTEEVETPKIIKSDRFQPKPMDIEEALKQLELSGEDLIVFLNAETRNVNVLYRQKDGTYELIEANV